MALAGFSQGGALCLYTGLSLSPKVAGILVMSGYFAGASSFQMTPGVEETPILHCHGTQDPIVDYLFLGKHPGKPFNVKIHIWLLRIIMFQDCLQKQKSILILHAV
jgi:poly(3-hydroxybutyrate) depolymerase